MSKFKVGDKVFHIGLGIGVIVCSDTTYTIDGRGVRVHFENASVSLKFELDGRLISSHSIPQLYTLAEARKMGFAVPKEKIKKSKTVWLYHGPTSGSTYVCEQQELTQVGFIEREVTFEWEEEV